MSRQWIRLPERGTGAALGLIYWIGIRLGRTTGRLLLYPITLYFLLTAATPRRASRAFLRQLLGYEPGYRHIFRHMHCFAATLLDRAYLLAGQTERFDIRIHGGQLIFDQIASGGGCILLGSHLGSFEVLRVLGVTLCHFPLKVLMNIDHNQTITRLANALNPEIAATIIPIRGPETLLKAKESLEQGCLVGTLGDRVVATDRTVPCRFLGRPTRFPAGPMLLAAMLRCPVILAVALYRGGNCYEIYFERLADRIVLEQQQRQADLQYWTQRYVDRLEYYVRSAPYNWFNFYDYWQEDGP
ncbi:MAG: lipid A biosynthesis acyltransferase [Candidatus Competibacteraceae bacterium]